MNMINECKYVYIYMRNHIVYRNYIFLILNSLYINQTNAIQMITYLYSAQIRVLIKNTKYKILKL